MDCGSDCIATIRKEFPNTTYAQLKVVIYPNKLGEYKIESLFCPFDEFDEEPHYSIEAVCETLIKDGWKILSKE